MEEKVRVRARFEAWVTSVVSCLIRSFWVIQLDNFKFCQNRGYIALEWTVYMQFCEIARPTVNHTQDHSLLTYFVAGQTRVLIFKAVTDADSLFYLVDVKSYKMASSHFDVNHKHCSWIQVISYLCTHFSILTHFCSRWTLRHHRPIGNGGERGIWSRLLDKDQATHMWSRVFSQLSQVSKQYKSCSIISVSQRSILTNWFDFVPTGAMFFDNLI